MKTKNLVVAPLLTIPILSLATALQAQARSLEIYTLQNGLAEVFVAEGLCGFSYDQEAIRGFITSHVPPDDMTFAQDMTNSAAMDRSSIVGISPSQKMAFCSQMGQDARHYGFMK